MEFIVTTIDGFMALPELDMPAIPNSSVPGKTYRVLKVGFYMATREECERHSLSADAVREGKHPLATAVVEIDGQKKFVRLPSSLAPWAFTVVNLALTKHNFFPAEVEFGILEDRHYAELL